MNESERLVILWERGTLDSQRALPRLIELEEVRAGDVFQLVPIDDEDTKTPHTFGLSRASSDATRHKSGIVVVNAEPHLPRPPAEPKIERAVNRAIAETAREDGDAETLSTIADKLYRYLGIEI